MFYVRFTIKDYTTKEKRIKTSEKYNNIDMALEVVDRYLSRQKNYINIESLGNNKTLVQKFGGEILVEVLQ